MAKVKKQKNRCKTLAILGVILGIILVTASIIGISWTVHSFSPKGGYGDYVFDGGAAEFNLDLFPSLVVDKDASELKIMQIADPQIKFGAYPQKDRNTFALLEKAIKTQQPDLCVVTGDLTLSVFSYDAIKYFADFMQKMNVKWAYVYGNHDSQFDCSKYTIYNLLKNYDNCLFSPGPSDIYGESNYLVNIFKGEKSSENLIYSLVLLDSGMYPQGENVALSEWVYDWIHQSQMDWYTWAINGLKSVKSDIQTSMFFHIPIKEFATMYYISEKNKGNEIPQAVEVTLPSVEVQGVTGTVCEDDKKDSEYVFGDDGYTVGIYYQGNGAGVTDHPDVFEYVKKLDCTKAIFCGHDHVNTLKGYYDGVYLGYGLCCGYHTYPFFDKPNFLTDLLGTSDKVNCNAQLWVDENGVVMEKGVTMIQISLGDSDYGKLIVTDKRASTLK